MLDVIPASTAAPATSSAAIRPSQSLSQIPALTGLRFFAAFFILLAHSADWLAQFQDSEIRQKFSFIAMYGMPLFFVLSGFVIHYNYRRLFTSRGAIMATCEFAAARFARLFPLYFCLLLMAIAADNFVGKVQGQDDLWAKILAFYVTLTQSWWYVVYGDKELINWLFPLSWSISTEMFFYCAFVAVVFPILAIRTPRQSTAAAISYAVIVSISLLIVRHFLPNLLGYAQHHVPDYIGMDHFGELFFRWLFYFSPYVRVLEFFMGCLAAHAFMLHVDRPVTAMERRIADIALVLAFTMLCLFGACTLGFFGNGELTSYVKFLELNFLCAPAIAFVLLYVSRYDSAFTRFMSLPALVILGDTSYSIYLIHTWTLRLFMRHPPQQLNWLWGPEALLRITCGILLTLVVSYATYRLIEVPSSHLVAKKAWCADCGRIWRRRKMALP